MSINNRAQRIIVALVAIPLIIFISYIGKIPFLIFTVAIGAISYYEFSKMCLKKEIYPNLLIGLLAVIFLVLNYYFQTVSDIHLIIAIVILVSIVELFRNKGSAITNIGASLLGIFYLGLFSSCILLVREFYNYSDLLYPEGGYIFISVLASIWVCDSAAYFLGTAFGKHKLFPRVSPNKSWEGAIAGFVFAILTMLASHSLLLEQLTVWQALTIGLIVGLFGQLGDLVESLFKRDAGVKDSSALIPGHGGIFDRFDSLLFIAPFIYLYLHLIG